MASFLYAATYQDSMVSIAASELHAAAPLVCKHLEVPTLLELVFVRPFCYPEDAIVVPPHAALLCSADDDGESGFLTVRVGAQQLIEQRDVNIPYMREQAKRAAVLIVDLEGSSLRYPHIIGVHTGQVSHQQRIENSEQTATQSLQFT